jgi:hypothetical protein
MSAPESRRPLSSRGGFHVALGSQARTFLAAMRTMLSGAMTAGASHRGVLLVDGAAREFPGVLPLRMRRRGDRRAWDCERTGRRVQPRRKGTRRRQ